MEAVPITMKYLLTPDEASALSGLPANLLRFYGKLAKDDNNFSFPCSWAGTHMKINRIGLERWLLERADGHFDFTEKYILEQMQATTAKRGRPRKVR